MQGKLTLSHTVGGRIIRVKFTRDGSGAYPKEIDMPPGIAGKIAQGNVTAAGHGIMAGQAVAVFWADASGNLKCRHGLVAGTIAGNVVPVTGGNGDTLPDAGNVIISPAVLLSSSTVPPMAPLTGSQMLQFTATCDQRGVLQLMDSAGAELIQISAEEGGEGTVWCDGTPQARPFAATADQAIAYNGSTKDATWSLSALLV